MPEIKDDGILSLNVKELLILHLVWETNRILQYGSLFFIMRLILVRIWRDNLPKYGRAIQCFNLWSDFITFCHEIYQIKSILYKNSYLRDLVDKSIKEFLDKILAPKPVVSTVLKKNLVIALPYLTNSKYAQELIA